MALDLGAIMDAIGSRLATISGLRVADYPSDQANPPQAIVSLPTSIEYDAVMGRGADRAVIPVMVLVGRVSDRVARDLMCQYLSGTGSLSIKTALEPDLAGAAQTVRVTVALPPDIVTVGGVEYLGTSLEVEVYD